MNLLLAVHITGGSLAIISGFTSIFALKGGVLHRRSGKIFLYSMLALGVTGIIIAIIRSQPGNISGGSSVVYMVGTGVLTLRRRDQRSVWIDAAAVALGVGVFYFSLAMGIRIFNTATGRLNGVPYQMFFFFTVVMLLALLGDLRMMLKHGLLGRQRIVRHLWRMSFSLFIASGSFFLGQAKVIPKPIRYWPALITLAVLPLVMLIYWVVRVSFSQWARRRGAPFIERTRARAA